MRQTPTHIHRKRRTFALAAFALLVLKVGAAYAADGIWISRDEVEALPRSGPAWQNVFDEAQLHANTPKLSNDSDPTNVRILAKALVFAATGEASYRSDVKTALSSIVNSGPYGGYALALGRELGAYVIAADLIDLRHQDAALDQQFRAKLRELRTAQATADRDSLVMCHEKRPNNWGTHCGATRIAIARYLDDAPDLAACVKIFKGWLGDRTAYSAFVFGSLGWQSDHHNPVGINPLGATISGHSVDGVLPDDQRRAGPFAWPPPKTLYAYGGLEGALAQAVLLSRAGYDVWNWQDRALLRAFTWLNTTRFDDGNTFPAEGDDAWQPHVVNSFYGTAFPAPVPALPGKNIGWTDWTHGQRAAGSACSGSSVSLSLTHSASGDDVLNVRGSFVLPPGGVGSFSPATAGIDVSVATSTAQIIAAASATPFNGTSGWKTSARVKRWVYLDKRKQPPNGGIKRLRISAGGRSSAQMRVTLKAVGSYALTSANGPPTLSFAPANGSLANGCDEFTFSFADNECSAPRSQTDVDCEARTRAAAPTP